MKIFKNVRSTAEYVSSVEVNVDTAYIRSNIAKIDEEDFKGWEYDEIQYDKDKYMEQLTSEDDIGAIANLLSLVLSELDMIKMMIGGM